MSLARKTARRKAGSGKIGSRVPDRRIDFSEQTSPVRSAISITLRIFKALQATFATNAAEMKKVVTTNEQVGVTAAATSGQLGREAAALKQATAGANEYSSTGKKVVTTNEQISASNSQLNSTMNLSRGAMKAGAQEMTNYISRAAGMFISVVGLSQAVQESVGMQDASAEAT